MRLGFWGICLALAFASVSSADFILDGFEDGAFDVEVVRPASSDSDTLGPGLTDVLGGERLVDVMSVAGPDGEAARAKLVITGSDDAMSYTNESNVSSELKLTYGATTNLNTDVSGDLALEIRLRSIDLSTDITVTLFSGLEGLGVSQSVLHTTSTPGPVYFQYTDFPLVDLSDVDRFEVLFAGDPALDLQAEFFGSTALVPEPSAGLLALLAAVGLGMFRRRRR